jgi:hypothetical protein
LVVRPRNGGTATGEPSRIVVPCRTHAAPGVLNASEACSLHVYPKQDGDRWMSATTEFAAGVVPGIKTLAPSGPRSYGYPAPRRASTTYDPGVRLRGRGASRRRRDPGRLHHLRWLRPSEGSAVWLMMSAANHRHDHLGACHRAAGGRDQCPEPGSDSREHRGQHAETHAEQHELVGVMHDASFLVCWELAPSGSNPHP